MSESKEPKSIGYTDGVDSEKLVSHTAIGTPIISNLREFLSRVKRTPLHDRIIFSYSTPLEKKTKKVSLEKCLLLVCLQQHGRIGGSHERT